MSDDGSWGGPSVDYAIVAMVSLRDGYAHFPEDNGPSQESSTSSGPLQVGISMKLLNNWIW